MTVSNSTASKRKARKLPYGRVIFLLLMLVRIDFERIKEGIFRLNKREFDSLTNALENLALALFRAGFLTSSQLQPFYLVSPWETDESTLNVLTKLAKDPIMGVGSVEAP